MYKIDIKETLYPIQIVLVVYKKFSKTSVFIDRKWPILVNDVEIVLHIRNPQVCPDMTEQLLTGTLNLNSNKS